MNRQSKFEQLWADRHGISPDDLIQYRFKEKDGYRLPAMAAHYRTFCDTLDSVASQINCSHGPWSDNYTYCTSCGYYDKSRGNEDDEEKEASGLRVTQ